MGLLKTRDILYLNVKSRDEAKQDIKPVLYNKAKGISAPGVSGKLIKITKQEGTYDNKPTVTYNFLLQDGNDFFSVGVNGKSFTGYSLLHCMGNVNTNLPIEISVYRAKLEKGGKVYMGLRQNDQLVKWDESFAKPIENKNEDGEKSYAWSPVIKAFDEFIVKFNASQANLQVEVTESNDSDDNEEDVEVEEITTEIPF